MLSLFQLLALIVEKNYRKKSASVIFSNSCFLQVSYTLKMNTYKFLFVCFVLFMLFVVLTCIFGFSFCPYLFVY